MTNDIAEADAPLYDTAPSVRQKPLSDDHAREELIEYAYQQMVTAPTEQEQRQWQDAMVELIGQRSAAQVARMESKRGLRR